MIDCFTLKSPSILLSLSVLNKVIMLTTIDINERGTDSKLWTVIINLIIILFPHYHIIKRLHLKI